MYNIEEILKAAAVSIVSVGAILLVAKIISNVIVFGTIYGF